MLISPAAIAPAACAQSVFNWVDETSTFLKMVDPNHLVTFGEEGFFAANSTRAKFNPAGTPGNVQQGTHLLRRVPNQHDVIIIVLLL